VHALVRELLAVMPADSAPWPRADRERWIAALAAVLDVVYDDEGRPVEAPGARRPDAEQSGPAGSAATGPEPGHDPDLFVDLRPLHERSYQPPDEPSYEPPYEPLHRSDEPSGPSEYGFDALSEYRFDTLSEDGSAPADHPADYPSEYGFDTLSDYASDAPAHHQADPADPADPIDPAEPGRGRRSGRFDWMD
jgi:hypothetical protein